MKKYFPLFIFLLIFLFNAYFCPMVANDSASQSNSILEDLQRGQWLNKDYIERLKATRSPKKATAGIYVSFFQIEHLDNLYFAKGIFNFHEGATAFTFTGIRSGDKKNTYHFVNAKQYYPEQDSEVTLLKTKTDDEIQWTYYNGEKFTQTFVRVEPDVVTFINRVLLAGEYRDEKNHKFEFTESGVAKWQEESFRYQISLDFVGSVKDSSPFNNFYVVNSRGIPVTPPKYYCFLWKGDSLFIYDADRYGNCNIAPLYTLKKEGNNENKKKFEALYKDLVEFRKKLSVQVSSRTKDKNNCEAYRQIVKGGNTYLPFIIEKIKEGDFFLNQAMQDISHVNIYQYYKDINKEPIGEQGVSELWLRWWEENKHKY